MSCTVCGARLVCYRCGRCVRCLGEVIPAQWLYHYNEEKEG